MSVYNEITSRFDSAQAYADESIDKAQKYMATLESLLESLEIPSDATIDEVDLPDITPINFNEIPSFAAALENFPSFDNEIPESPTLEDIPDIDVDYPQESIDFVENDYTAPSISLGNAPEDTTNIEEVTTPDKPDLNFPDVPTLTDIELPSEPTIDLPSFDATKPSLSELSTPVEFSFTEDSYSSDIKVALFAKILNDVQNGGTGLDVDVEEDIYDRARERQRVENERLYREMEDQFSATGFRLPSGALASRLQQAAEEISRKTDQTNREITISQAELAQNNTQFSVQQAVACEKILRDFFSQQQTRALESAKAQATNAINVFNALVAKEQLKLEKYQAEADVFEKKVRAELTSVEIYKAQVEGVRLKTEADQAKIALYNSQIDGLKILLQMYVTEMEAAKVQADVQVSKIEVFKAQTEAYLAQVEAEKAKADVYQTQTESERNRAAVYGEKVRAYQTRVEAAKAEAQGKQYEAENTLRKNQLLLEEYRAKVEAYRAEIEAEVRNAGLEVEGFRSETMAYEALLRATGTKYEARISENQTAIEYAKTQLQKEIATVDAIRQGYVSLKELQVKGTESQMNVNAQLAASAMNAVSVSMSKGESSSEGVSEVHSYDHGEV